MPRLLSTNSFTTTELATSKFVSNFILYSLNASSNILYLLETLLGSISLQFSINVSINPLYKFYPNRSSSFFIDCVTALCSNTHHFVPILANIILQ